VLEAVRLGEISKERIDDAFKRIRALKERKCALTEMAR
jgi:hypothetical protein